MRKFAALFLAFAIISLNIFSLFSCSGFDLSDILPIQDGEDETPKGPGAPPVSATPEKNPESEIHVPQYKDYGRGTLDFEDIEYSRPDISKAISDFESTTKLINDNEISYSEQLSKIQELESGFNVVSTMYTYANVMNSANSSDEIWKAEYEFIATEYPKFMQAVEALFVAAATSAHAQSFEADYFGDGLIEEYGKGAKYTDSVITLMKNEAELEVDYTSLSAATVLISYNGYTATRDRIIELHKEIYGEDSKEYAEAESECKELAKDAVAKKSTDILIELIKLRKMISNELGYDSYAEFAYDEIYHDYSVEEFLTFARSVKTHIIPVYAKLSSYVFNQYPDPINAELSRVDLINHTHDMLKGTSKELAEIFEYMLQHSLYDIEKDNDTRFHGAFTAYFDSYNAPFIFISTKENITDYTTLCHEFGHFADSYINYNAQASLDLSEVSSQALELLASTKFDEILTDAEINYLKLYLVEDALLCLISQTFFAMLEHIVYEIPADELNLTSLNNAVKNAAKRVGLNSDKLDIETVLVPHLFLYPFYVQSYSTSVTAALDIYLTELETEGAGFEILDKILHRGEDSELTFTETLESVGLTDPFSNNYLMILSDRIHYNLLGSHYFKIRETANAA